MKAFSVRMKLGWTACVVVIVFSVGGAGTRGLEMFGDDKIKLNLWMDITRNQLKGKSYYKDLGLQAPSLF